MRYEKHGLCGVCGVYLLTNLSNGKRYVGSSVDVGRRISQHFTSAMNRYKWINEMYSDMSEIGRDGFKIEMLEECVPDNKIERERYWYQRILPEYNLVEPDSCPFKHEEVREKSRASQNTSKGRKNRIESHRTEKCREKCRNAQRKRMISCIGLSEQGNTPVFESITEAAKWFTDGDPLPRDITAISSALSGRRKTAFNYKWEVMKNEDSAEF